MNLGLREILPQAILQRGVPFRYGVAVAAVFMAAGFRLLLHPVFAAHASDLPFTLAVIVAAGFGGLGPALVGTVLGALILDWFFLAPIYSLSVANPDAVWEFSLFGARATAISLLVAYLRHALASKSKAEQELRRHAQLIDLSHDAVITTDFERRVVTWNKGAEQMYGWPERDAIGKVLHQLLQTAGRFSPSETDEILRQSRRWEGELSQVARDGRRLIVYSRQVLVGDEQGSAGILEINRDITARKAAEQAVRDNEERLRLAQRAGRSGTFEWDAQTDVSTLSNELLDLYGFGPNEFGGTSRDWLECLVPEDREAAENAVQHSFESGLFELEFRIRRRDSGEVRWIYGRGELRFDEAGRPARMIGINVDITERKRMEEALRLSEERVRVKLESVLSPDVEVGDLELRDIIDTEAIQSIMSDFYELTHVPVAVLDNRGDVLVGVGWQEICTRFHRVHPDTVKNCLESDTQLTVHTAPGEFKLYKCKNNLWDVATPFILAGRQLGNVFTGQFLLDTDPPNRDLFAAQAAQYGFDEKEYLNSLDAVPRINRETAKRAIDFLSKFGVLVGKLSYANIKLAKSLAELKRAQDAALRASEQRGLALEAANLGAWDQDFNTGGVFLDERARHMFGLPEEGQIDYSDIISRVHEDDRGPTDEAVQRALTGANGGVYDREFRVVWPDGSVHWIASHGRAFFEDEHDRQRVTRFIGINLDITERRRAEERLRRAQKMESIGLLAGGVAHDFNNLLTVIMGSASTGLLECPSSTQYQNIISASERAADLTKQLLAYAGKGEFIVKFLDLSDLLRESSQLLSASLPKRVKLVFNLSHEKLPIQADPSRIEQILMNLVINAGEAIPPKSDGGITIATSRCDVTPEMARQRAHTFDIQPGRFVCLEVADNGTGMDEATVSQIFDPFFSTKFTGRGLGLAAVHGIVRSSHGFVDVESSPGIGSRFRVFLPAAEKDIPAEIISPAEPNGSRSKERPPAVVLVVDDEAMVRDLARTALKRRGYEVLEARDGKEALGVLGRAAPRPRLVLLDLAMPAMGGDELVPILERDYPNVKIVISSGYPEEEVRKDVPLRAVAGFLQKPYTVVALTDKVQEVLVAGST